jgi:hypothetical protein
MRNSRPFVHPMAFSMTGRGLAVSGQSVSISSSVRLRLVSRNRLLAPSHLIVQTRNFSPLRSLARGGFGAYAE